MDAKFQALVNLFVEHLVVVRPLGNFCEHFKALLHKVLLDHAQDFVVLQSLLRNVQRRIHGVNDTVQPLCNKLVAAIHDENAAGIQN